MTKTCEALSEATTTTELLYCIEHERMVEVTNGKHIFIDKEWGVFGTVETCTFPKGWAYCPPPDEPVEETVFDGDWAAEDDPEPEEEGFWFGGGE